MNLKTKSSLIICLLLSTVFIYAQESSSAIPDSTSFKAYAYLTNQFSILRPLNVEYTYAAPTNFVSKVDNNDDTHGNRINHYSQIKVTSNINFIKQKNWVLGANVGYKKTDINLDLMNPQLQQKELVNINAHFFYGSINFAYSTKLFEKNAYFTSSIIADGSDEYFGRVKGLVTGNISLKSTNKTRILVGLILNIDQSSNTPIFPMFSLHHKFDNGIVADILLPKQIYFRKHLFDRSRLSLGTELDSNSFYLNQFNSSSTPQKFEYRQIDLYSGLKYEYLLRDNFILFTRVGVKSLVRNGVFNKKDKFNDHVFSTEQDPHFYFNVGISYNPFIKTKRK